MPNQPNNTLPLQPDPHRPEPPPIVIGETDEQKLTTMATSLASKGPAPNLGHTLLAELERAVVVPDRDVPENVVRMNSWLEYEIDGHDRRRVQIVFPGDANIDEGRISILTPIGTALIGLSPSQSIALRGHDGRPHELVVVSVAQPASAS